MPCLYCGKTIVETIKTQIYFFTVFKSIIFTFLPSMDKAFKPNQWKGG